MFFLADIPVSDGLPRGSGPAGPLFAFGLTFLIEWPLLAWWSGLGLRRTGPFCLALNAASWGLFMGLGCVLRVPVPLLEVGIIAGEAKVMAVVWQWRWSRALLLSLGVNVASWFLGTGVLMYLRVV